MPIFIFYPNTIAKTEDYIGCERVGFGGKRVAILLMCGIMISKKQFFKERNMEQFMHKEAIITVAGRGASHGTFYIGKIVNIDGDFVEIAYDPTKKNEQVTPRF